MSNKNQKNRDHKNRDDDDRGTITAIARPYPAVRQRPHQAAPGPTTQFTVEAHDDNRREGNDWISGMTGTTRSGAGRE